MFKIFNFVIAISAAMLIDVAGRRPLFMISNAGMLISVCNIYMAVSITNEALQRFPCGRLQQLCTTPTAMSRPPKLPFLSFSFSSSSTTLHTLP